jgi:hypothetical protein
MSDEFEIVLSDNDTPEKSQRSTKPKKNVTFSDSPLKTKFDP